MFFHFSSSDTRAGRSQVYDDDGMYPKGSYSTTSLVQCHHHFAQQLLLFTVVTVVVTSSTLCFFTVSLSLSLFVPVLGSEPVVYLQALFAQRLGHDAVLLTLSVQNNYTAAWHHLLGVTRVLVQVHPAPSSRASDS